MGLNFFSITKKIHDCARFQSIFGVVWENIYDLIL